MPYAYKSNPDQIVLNGELEFNKPASSLFIREDFRQVFIREKSTIKGILNTKKLKKGLI